MSVSTTDAARTFFRVLESGELDDLTPLLAESLVYIVPYSRTGDLAPDSVFDGTEQVLGHLNPDHRQP